MDILCSNCLSARLNQVLLAAMWLVAVAGALPHPQTQPRSRRDTRPLAAYQHHLLKRQNALVCSCCANSFNTNCCIQCGQTRLGKRTSPSYMEQVPLLTHDLSSDLDLGVEDDDLDLFDASSLVERSLTTSYRDWNKKGKQCACCLYQMKEHPFSQSWPCCKLCKRGKRSIMNDLGEEN